MPAADIISFVLQGMLGGTAEVCNTADPKGELFNLRTFGELVFNHLYFQNTFAVPQVYTSHLVF